MKLPPGRVLPALILVFGLGLPALAQEYREGKRPVPERAPAVVPKLPQAPRDLVLPVDREAARQHNLAQPQEPRRVAATVRLVRGNGRGPIKGARLVASVPPLDLPFDAANGLRLDVPANQPLQARVLSRNCRPKPVVVLPQPGEQLVVVFRKGFFARLFGGKRSR